MAEASLDITFDTKDAPTLSRFLRSNVFVRGAQGPFGSGKSAACNVEIFRRAMETPPCRDGVRRSRWLVVRNTYPQLRDTTIKTFEQWVPEELGKWNRTEHNFCLTKVPGVEAEVMFRALDRPQDVANLLSLELTGAYINEARETPRGIFDAIQGRIGRFPSRAQLPDSVVPWCGLWFDTNPPDTDHWIFKLFEEDQPDPALFALFKQPGGRSPKAENLPNLPAGYYERLASGKSPDFVKVYVDAEYGFVMDGRPVFPEFKDSLHVDESITPNERLIILAGQDFGLTPAAVLAQRDPKDGQLQVFDEYVSDDMGAVRFAQELARHIKSEYPGRKLRGHGDPAGEQRSQVDERTPFDVVQAAGLSINPAPTNDVTLRREAVAQNLMRLTIQGRPGIAIHPRCRVLRKALAGGYCYRRLQVAGRDAFTDKPDKNRFSHVADALQYLCVGEGEDSRAVGEEPNEAPVRVVVRRTSASR